ncbi:hypothetical protein P153DRAFT_388982 [Dothidotthia symphoricarpi CBS 119687]|uniref:Uncharacterized protein n=1 Tax=Dothidotthia symphoricarpi CBS 119687 TaxID=1392245 RepID=A0A6A6A2Z0_9PLEO|nr:uncharacterized protein P153DRAFT_388982 [Dothidotthia symphoricarpi CBS 119687]KAF2126239.1 hypothetical protein P153DRAFT_388982 [Dothidotthia symphoricarpi CBS 119687]
MSDNMPISSKSAGKMPCKDVPPSEAAPVDTAVDTDNATEENLPLAELHSVTFDADDEKHLVWMAKLAPCTDDIEVARRLSLQPNWEDCRQSVLISKEGVDAWWGSGNQEGIQDACEGLTSWVLALLQVLEQLDGLNEQESARCVEEWDQTMAASLPDSEKCRECGGCPCRGVGPSNSARDEDVNNWQRMWNAMGTAESGLMVVWFSRWDILMRQCAKMRRACQKLLRMLEIVRLGRDPSPGEYEIDC